VLRRLMNSIERRVFGPHAFLAHAQATKALLKFCVDHGSTHPDLANLRACLDALEAGEQSNAIDSHRRVPTGKETFRDWWPPAVAPSETEEYASAVFAALVERWDRLMDGLGNYGR
jgi:hypothetical protein